MDQQSTATSRRDFIKLAAAAGGALAAMHATGIPGFAETGVSSKYITMIDLPFPANALVPYLSEKTVKQHYNEHHQSYYDRLTAYIKTNPEYDKIPLKDLIIKTRGGILLEDALFNIAVLLWNHNFYWQSIKPKGGILPEKKSALTKQIVASFGSLDKFKKKFTQRCMEIGIGWVWLIKIPNGLEIVRTDYHNNFIPSHYPPLITIDVWEHAYYMDYGNNREKYVGNYLDHLVNWEFAEANFKGPEGTKKKPKKGKK